MKPGGANLLDLVKTPLRLIPVAQLEQHIGEVRGNVDPDTRRKPRVRQALQAPPPDHRCVRETARGMEFAHSVRLEPRKVDQQSFPSASPSSAVIWSAASSGARAP